MPLWICAFGPWFQLSIVLGCQTYLAFPSSLKYLCLGSRILLQGFGQFFSDQSRACALNHVSLKVGRGWRSTSIFVSILAISVWPAFWILISAAKQIRYNMVIMNQHNVLWTVLFTLFGSCFVYFVWFIPGIHSPSPYADLDIEQTNYVMSILQNSFAAPPV